MTDRELMQMALDVMLSAIKAGDWKVDGACDPDFVLEALRARLAQPEQEPVTMVISKTGDSSVTMSWWHEPALPVGTPLYAAPPQREWVGLTEGETIDLALSAFELPEVSSETREKIHRDLVIAMNDQDSRLMLFAANIEAKLKEKNT